MERKTQRISLGQLKRTLDKIPIGELDTCFIMHPYASENPDDDKIQVIKWGDDWEEFFYQYGDETREINKFADAITEDVIITQKVKKNPEKMEDFQDDIEC